MGCGESNRAKVEAPTGKADRRPEGDHSGKHASHEHRSKTESRPTLTSKKGEENDDQKIVKDISGIVIEPSQFVFEKSESIYKSYSLREKLGEGTFLSLLHRDRFVRNRV